MPQPRDIIGYHIPLSLPRRFETKAFGPNSVQEYFAYRQEWLTCRQPTLPDTKWDIQQHELGHDQPTTRYIRKSVTTSFWKIHRIVWQAV